MVDAFRQSELQDRSDRGRGRGFRGERNERGERSIRGRDADRFPQRRLSRSPP